VKPDKMDERLKRLAESMEDLPIEGTTRIGWSCLTEREKLLYDKADLIAQKPLYHSQLCDGELLARADEIFEDCQLLGKWHELYLRRIIDLFVTAFPRLTAYDLDDDVAEWYFKLQNPRLLRISFHTFRHWKATMFYHQTKNPILTMTLLGHKKLDTTLLYIQIDETLFKDMNDEFMVNAAKTPEEVKSLLEVGFEFVCQKDDLLFFRKRK
jgi:hypothetical protein